jgi:3-oxoacyl-[acyl-carrier protein] reductase
MAQHLACDGCAIGLTDVSHPESANAVELEVEALGRKAVSVKADSANPTDIQMAVAEVAEKLSMIDAAVVNAAILRHAYVETFSLEDLDLKLDLNVRGVLLSILASVAQMRDGGWLITIRSNTAIRTGSPGNIVYAMTKAAVAALVIRAALDRANRRITGNGYDSRHGIPSQGNHLAQVYRSTKRGRGDRVISRRPRVQLYDRCQPET